MNISINKLSLTQDLTDCFNIRREVFIEGQNISVEDEVDGRDSESDHYLLLLDGKPIATTRVRYIENKAKIERVAVLQEFQGQGYGKKLMQHILKDIKQSSKTEIIVLGAQSYIIPFYETLGFSVCSDEYMDAGIPHKDMHLKLRL